MAWVTIIATVLELLGPVLQDLLKNCMEDQLNDAAADLPAAETYGSDGLAAEALFEKAIANLPFWARFRKRALRRAKAVAVQGNTLRAYPLSESEIREGFALVGSVRAESHL
jgi:hypothetical protein